MENIAKSLSGSHLRLYLGVLNISGFNENLLSLKWIPEKTANKSNEASNFVEDVKKAEKPICHISHL